MNKLRTYLDKSTHFLIIVIILFFSVGQTVNALTSGYDENTIRELGFKYIGTDPSAQALAACSVVKSSSGNTTTTTINVAETVAGLSIEDKIAQTFVVGVNPGQAAEVKVLVQKFHIGGLAILNNTDDKTFNKTYFDSLNISSRGIPMLISADQEGGTVQRFKGVSAVGNQPSAKDLGAKGLDVIEAAGKQVGAGLKGLGVTVDLAPVLDLDNGVNGISTSGRSFSGTTGTFDQKADAVSQRAGAYAKGLQEGGVTPTFKHFPGHGRGSGTGISDDGIVTTPALSDLETSDLKPYKQLANQYGSAVMLGNLIVPGLTENDTTLVSFSPAAIKLLRGEIGFKGLITTDDLYAGSLKLAPPKGLGLKLPDSVQKAMLAGVDAPLFTFTSEDDIQQAINQVKANVPIDRINQAVTNMLNFKNGPAAVGAVTAPTAQNAAATTTGGAQTTTTIAAGSSIYVLGDSITHRAQPVYENAIKTKGFTPVVDASDSRSITANGKSGNLKNGLDAVTLDHDVIAAASVIIVALGTNGGNDAGTVSQLVGSATAKTGIRGANATAPIYWVDTIGVGGKNFTAPAVKSSNQAIYNAKASGLINDVIPWFNTVMPSGDAQNPVDPLTDTSHFIDNSDGLGVHPTSAGSNALVAVVMKSISGGATTTDTSGNSCSSGSSKFSGSTAPGEHLKTAFGFLISQGLTPQQAAGILGNIVHESPGVTGTSAAPLKADPPEPQQEQGHFQSLVPVQNLPVGDIHNSQIGWGIVQWTPASKLIDNAKKAGRSDDQINSLEYQLTFLIGQITGIGDGAMAKDPFTLDKYKQKSSTAEEAAATFAIGYERCQTCQAGTSNVNARSKSAADILQQYGSGP